MKKIRKCNLGCISLFFDQTLLSVFLKLEICIEAVKQIEYALKNVPEELKEEVKQELEKMKNNDEDTVKVLGNSDSKIR